MGQRKQAADTIMTKKTYSMLQLRWRKQQWHLKWSDSFNKVEAGVHSQHNRSVRRGISLNLAGIVYYDAQAYSVLFYLGRGQKWGAELDGHDD
jgi:hypothetical protein